MATLMRNKSHSFGKMEVENEISTVQLKRGIAVEKGIFSVFASCTNHNENGRQIRVP